jgi:hypothetical protein
MTHNSARRPLSCPTAGSDFADGALLLTTSPLLRSNHQTIAAGQLPIAGKMIED